MRTITTAFIYLMIFNMLMTIISGLYVSSESFENNEILLRVANAQIAQGQQYANSTTTGSQSNLLNTINPPVDVNPSMSTIFFQLAKGVSGVNWFTTDYNPTNSGEKSVLLLLISLQAIINIVIYFRLALLIYAKTTQG